MPDDFQTEARQAFRGYFGDVADRHFEAYQAFVKSECWKPIEIRDPNSDLAALALLAHTARLSQRSGGVVSLSLMSGVEAERRKIGQALQPVYRVINEALKKLNGVHGRPPPACALLIAKELIEMTARLNHAPTKGVPGVRALPLPLMIETMTDLGLPLHRWAGALRQMGFQPQQTSPKTLREQRSKLKARRRAGG